MNLPHEGELTKTEDTVYSVVCDVGGGHIPSTAGIANVLAMEEPLVAAVCDGLEAMGFIQKYGGMWHPNYTES